MATHTPGPWGRCAWAITDPRDSARSLAFVCNKDITEPIMGVLPVTEEEADANASLIAAAPELLAALQDALSCIEYNGLEQTGGGRTALHRGRAAIAEAEGR